MAVQNLKYCEYFDVNEKYFPCIDESAINGGEPWDNTYPHKTFIDLLSLTEKMLGGQYQPIHLDSRCLRNRKIQVCLYAEKDSGSTGSRGQSLLG